MIPTMHTHETPIRYKAFKNEGVFIILVGEGRPVEMRGGLEVAWYWAPQQNEVYPNLVDGVYGDVHVLHPVGKRGFYAEVVATRPDGSRRQYVRSQIFGVNSAADVDIIAARNTATLWLRSAIPEAHAWLERPAHEVLRESAAWNRGEAERVKHDPVTGTVQAAGFKQRAYHLEEQAKSYEANAGVKS